MGVEVGVGFGAGVAAISAADVGVATGRGRLVGNGSGVKEGAMGLSDFVSGVISGVGEISGSVVGVGVALVRGSVSAGLLSHPATTRIISKNANAIPRAK